MEEINEEINDAKVEPKEEVMKEIYGKVIKHTNKIYTDLTGKFPYCSSKENQYVFVLYDYDGNNIMVEWIKNQSEDELIRAYKKLIKFYTLRGIKPIMHVMDNEASQAFQEEVERNYCTYQLVPPHIHHRNAAEKTIQIFKHHFLAGLASVHPNFPMHLWDRLLPQAIITPNLLRTYRINPKLLAYEYLNGTFDYNATSLAPPGIKVLIHKKVDQHTLWGFHGKEW
eukprot:1762152-Ditylum_brightwellii.AAC.1